MFGGGGGGLNPGKMDQLMEQMGVEMDELDAEEVVIRLADGDELVFDGSEVTKMEARGQSTYMVVGDPERREAGADAGGPETGDDSADEADATIPDEDVELVVQRTGASAADAREALEAEDGDLAAAISRLE